ncbi:hypothetical protein Bca52824_093971 [Brassica carinata]|uniref:Uncharacterized protein n=1 Tax=Brassica carinata TaxID=52824 RepID=A0A8X7P592_BRACI|nr:hypothetical protein Bca52824_093971 [Brassica carinata]
MLFSASATPLRFSGIVVPEKPSRMRMKLSIRSSSSNKFDLRRYWRTLIKEINEKLEEAIPVKYPTGIYEAMRYSVLAKGAKRAPPVMCVAACELFGGDRLAAFPTACALEMVHAASLIHDDLPCMDDDPVRRGKPSNHTVFGADMAILAGDALFPLGFHHIVSLTPPHLVPPSTILRLISEIARTVGSTGMAAGQYVDLEGGPFPFSFAQEKKFGAMGECSAVCGGLLGGATDDELQSLRLYGRAVGMLYQVVDDIRDHDNNTKKNSYSVVFGTDRAMEMADELIVKAKKELQVFDKYGDASVAPLYSFVDYAAHRDFLLHV